MAPKKKQDIVNENPLGNPDSQAGPTSRSSVGNARLINEFGSVHNRLVRQAMRDSKEFLDKYDEYLKSTDPNRREPIPKNAREKLARLCFFDPDESVSIALLKATIFNNYVKLNVPDSFYGIPYTDFHNTITIYPQIELYFRELKSSARNMGRQPVHSTINVRYRKDIEQVTETELRSIAREIANLFVGYKLERGTGKATYYDKVNGYQLSYFAKSKTDAKSFFTKVLSIQNDSFEELAFTWSEKDHVFSGNDYKTILGKRQKMPRKRPVADLNFRHALFKANGLRRDIPLVDTTGIFDDAYESRYRTGP
ncbi:MAG: hypothetical protein MH825_08090 [Cyanobacteria bacterium]|nr:hypothetical protein [Cyanobacteriota bacterium]